MALQNGGRYRRVHTSVAALLVAPPNYPHHYSARGSVYLSFQQVRLQSGIQCRKLMYESAFYKETSKV